MSNKTTTPTKSKSRSPSAPTQILLEVAGGMAQDNAAPSGSKAFGGVTKAALIPPPVVPTSDTLATVHRLASRLHGAGVFSKTTMREYDELCLTEVRPMGAQDIRVLREKVGLSQAVLARVLNVTTNAVGQWERGEKRPTGSALKLLALVREKGIAAVL